ncbi:hypothetical protein [Brucella tritici]|uniref:hypothetical protein n=1 Tax=Brucella tritici TaxID=94626 RepID=UPI00159199C4|nr:hypothetical protein [Brucella tritici]
MIQAHIHRICLALSTCTLMICGQAAAATNENANEPIMRKLIGEVKRCWTVPLFSTGVTVQVAISLDRNGNLIGKPALIKPKATKKYQEISQIALKAVVDCAPYRTVKEHPDKYDALSEVRFYFE